MNDLVNIYDSPDFVDVEKIKKEQEERKEGGILQRLNVGGQVLEYKLDDFSLDTIRKTIEKLYSQYEERYSQRNVKYREGDEDGYLKIFTGEGGMREIDRAMREHGILPID